MRQCPLPKENYILGNEKYVLTKVIRLVSTYWQKYSILDIMKETFTNERRVKK